MKAQSEITHLKDVETGFLRFSSAIEDAISRKKEIGRLSESIPLGGGEFTFDTAKSGGSLRILGENYMEITVTNETIQSTSTLQLSNYSYQPVNNFWQDQGYVWSYGYVNVTKDKLATPLTYYTMENVSYGMTGSLFDLDANCSSMTVDTVSIIPAAGHTRTNGNGNGMLVLKSTVTPPRQFVNITDLTVGIDPVMPDGFRDALWNVVYRRVGDLPSCANVPVPIRDNDTHTIVFSQITTMNLTLQTTEISVGAL
jgi:hypothetical protein